MDFIDLALLVTVTTVAIVGLVLLVDALRGRRGTCPKCGAVRPDDDTPCMVCEVRSEHGAIAAEDRGQERSGPGPRPHPHPQPKGHVDPDVGYLNPGITKGMVRASVVAMTVGLSVRFVGMLTPMGVDVPVPASIMATLTILGGVIAFVGFVVLDVA